MPLMTHPLIFLLTFVNGSFQEAVFPSNRSSLTNPAAVYLKVNYRNLALHLPITSPWHTSSALNSEPSNVR